MTKRRDFITTWIMILLLVQSLLVLEIPFSNEISPFGNASGKSIIVDDDGGRDYKFIQSAINDADPGDTIFVYSGVYDENIVIRKTISLIGNGSTDTVIDGRHHNGLDTVRVLADWVNISGFTLKNSGGRINFDAGLQIENRNSVSLTHRSYFRE